MNLPKHVSSFRDRHGKLRLRFRKAGMVSGYISAPLETDEFTTQYQAYMDGEVMAKPRRPRRSERKPPRRRRGSFARLMTFPCVYFVAAGKSGPVKIGYTAKLVNRMKELQIGAHQTLKLLLAIPGDQSVEKRFHEMFAADRIRGEWFSLSDQISSEINRLQAASVANQLIG